MDEFALINTYFVNTKNRSVIGNDCASYTPPENHDLVTSVDTLVADVHFSENDPHLGHKSLAVSLSDLAACGAAAHSFTLALTLPSINHEWLEKFSTSLFNLANAFNCNLIGGDISKGPLSITIQATGFVPTGKAIMRSTATPGDRIYVSNTIGGAGLAFTKNIPEAMDLLYQPQPQVELGIALRDIASSAIDISDGLASDLNHILKASNVGAKINFDKLPPHPLLEEFYSKEEALKLALSNGDDYQLCFTAPKEKIKKLNSKFCITEIGEIIAEKNNPFEGFEGYKHF